MPLIVDHDERRRHVAAIASGLIARKGLYAVTVRDVAQAAGYSTKIVSHYFKDKDALLRFVFREEAAAAVSRVRQAHRGKDLQACLELLLPLDAVTRRDWRMWIAFWGRAAFDRAFAREQTGRAREARKLITELLEEQRRAGRLAVECDCAFHASRLLSALVGIATQAIFDPRGWPAHRQRAVLAAELATLPVGAVSAAMR